MCCSCLRLEGVAGDVVGAHFWRVTYWRWLGRMKWVISCWRLWRWATMPQPKAKCLKAKLTNAKCLKGIVPTKVTCRKCYPYVERSPEGRRGFTLSCATLKAMWTPKTIDLSVTFRRKPGAQQDAYEFVGMCPLLATNHHGKLLQIGPCRAA